MIPVPWLVGHRVWSQAGSDEFGNPVQSWAEPVPLWVHGVGPRDASSAPEPGRPNRDLVMEGLSVFAPAGTRVGPHDRVVWPFPGGDEYDVDGDVGDYTAGPWPNPAAGVVVNLRRVEG